MTEKENYGDQLIELLKDMDSTHAFQYGIKKSNSFTADKLMEMLEGDNMIEQYMALGAIGKEKLKKALPALKNMALYHEDISIQETAIDTIRKIGGKEAVDILRYLKSTEHKQYIEENFKL